MSTNSNSRRRQYRSLRELSDEDLMELLQQGIEEAFTVLVRRHYQRVKHYLLGYVRNLEQSEDLTQETFLRVYRSCDSYRRIAKFTTWLYTIAGNLARSDFRRRTRAQFFSLHVPAEGGTYDVDVRDDEPEPDDAANQTLIDELIQKALRDVPDYFREVVVLRDFQELTYEEIGQITGLPMGTVKSRIHRGRSVLQDLLNDAVGTAA